MQQGGMSTIYLLLRLPLTGNHRHLYHQWCDESWTWTTEENGNVFTAEFHFYLQSRWSNSVLETPCWEAAELLHYT
ncbi:hypothetical protein TNCV_3715231 [Trichonephila clavipes]|nr:hypothetical protein TNCV_3715231 [Trichonephila clavipes]